MSKKLKTMKLGGITFKEEKVGKKEYTEEDIQRIAAIHDKRITPEILKQIGFVVLDKKDVIKREIWCLKVPFYSHEIRFTQGDYPSNNPNCGMVSLHTPKHEVFTVDRNGVGYVGEEEASTITIAWYVNTTDRLIKIIQSITQVNCC